MENPLSVRANAFAIASIMSDPEAAALADTAAMLQAYGYCPPGLGGTSTVLPPHHRHHAGGLVGGGAPSASSLQLNHAICRSSASSGADCRFQIDWTSTAGSTTTSAAASASGGGSLLHQHLPHHQQQANGSAAASADIGEYSSGLKGMEGK